MKMLKLSNQYNHDKINRRVYFILIIIFHNLFTTWKPWASKTASPASGFCIFFYMDLFWKLQNRPVKNFWCVELWAATKPLKKINLLSARWLFIVGGGASISSDPETIKMKIICRIQHAQNTSQGHFLSVAEQGPSQWGKMLLSDR